MSPAGDNHPFFGNQRSATETPIRSADNYRSEFIEDAGNKGSLEGNSK